MLDGWWDEAWLAAGRDELLHRLGHRTRRKLRRRRATRTRWNRPRSTTCWSTTSFPTFYDRGADGLPRRWIARMKSSIAHLCPSFNMQRVVQGIRRQFLRRGTRALQASAGGRRRARPRSGRVGFAPTRRLVADTHRERRNGADPGTGGGQPHPRAGVDPAGADLDERGRRRALSGPAGFRRRNRGWRAAPHATGRRRARKGCKSSKPPRCPVWRAACTATRCGFSRSTPTKPEASCRG